MFLIPSSLRSFNWTTVRYRQLCDLTIQACHGRVSSQVVKWQNLQVWCHSQAVTSFLVLLCISTLRDEDRGPVGNQDRYLEQNAWQPGRFQNGVAACPSSSDPKCEC